MWVATGEAATYRGESPLSLHASFSSLLVLLLHYQYQYYFDISVDGVVYLIHSASIWCRRKKMSNININNRSNMAGESVGGRTLLDEFGSFEKGGFFDLGHPLLNRITESFIKAAGIGAVQAVSREAFFTAFEGSDGGDVTAPKSSHNNRFPNLRGETNGSSIEALVKNTGKESIQWGLAAGMYSGLTYGLKEARGTHDWKNSAVAGAVTGAVLALTSGGGSDNTSHDQVVQSAITGAALSTAANLLSGIF